MICKTILLIIFLNETEFTFNAFKLFQVLLFYTNCSIRYYSFICTQLNNFKYYISLTIQLNIGHFLHTIK